MRMCTYLSIRKYITRVHAHVCVSVCVYNVILHFSFLHSNSHLTLDHVYRRVPSRAVYLMLNCHHYVDTDLRDLGKYNLGWEREIGTIKCIFSSKVRALEN